MLSKTKKEQNTMEWDDVMYIYMCIHIYNIRCSPRTHMGDKRKYVEKSGSNDLYDRKTKQAPAILEFNEKISHLSLIMGQIT
jgi:hypothetical protein